MGLISSGGITSGMLGVGAIVATAIPSGQIVVTQIASGGLASGGIASGQITTLNLASGCVSWQQHLSGCVRSGHVGDAAVVSGSIASGSIFNHHVSDAGVLSGNIGSGQISTYHFGSGAEVTRSKDVVPLYSGGAWTVISCEMISGVRAVRINSSGRVEIAMAAVSGRMPAVGVVTENVASGIACNVQIAGYYQDNSGSLLFSGIGTRVHVGRSGQIAIMSGSWSSGGWLSGDLGQSIGIAVNSGGFLFNVIPNMYSGGVAGMLAVQGISPSYGGA